MFENFLREIESLKATHSVSVSVEVDKHGYIDKECPSAECQFQFKVLHEDWKTLFKDEAVFCPLCRYEAPANSWWTTEQLNLGRNRVTQHVKDRLHHAFHSGFRRFNYAILPIPAKEAIELHIACEKCGAHYAVIGSAFFCPCCGHNSVEKTFIDSLKKVEAKLDHLSAIKEAIATTGNKDDAETLGMSLIESGLTDCVVAFQRFSEEMYKKRTQVSNIPFNVFQRIDGGSQLWKDFLGEGYEDWLTATELADLKILFQRRHLLAHNEGIVDAKYLQRSGDVSYSIGQRIVTKEHDVRKLVDIIKRISDECIKFLATR